MVVFRWLSNLICKNFWILFFVLVLPSVVKSTPLKNTDPLELYPNNIVFNVFRNDEIVGKHRVFFSKIGNGKVRVVAQLNLQVNFLSFPIYKFDYKSDAVWSDGKLRSLRSNQNDDGESLTVKVLRKNGWLVVKTRDAAFRTDIDTLPTNHWNAEVLVRDKVINTLTGELSSVRITNLGKEKIEAQAKSVFATKYKYSGDIAALVWYSDGGNWVKMQFEGKDGSNINYECIECGLGKK
jgi:hypothetical protein